MMLMLLELQQAIESPGVASWLAAIGGTAGLLALVSVGVVIGRWGNRMDAAERAIGERPTTVQMTSEIKALGKSLDNVREDVREVRDILLTGRRP